MSYFFLFSIATKDVAALCTGLLVSYFNAEVTFISLPVCGFLTILLAISFGKFAVSLLLDTFGVFAFLGSSAFLGSNVNTLLPFSLVYPCAILPAENLPILNSSPDLP